MNHKPLARTRWAALLALALTACPPRAAEHRDGNDVDSTDASVADGGAPAPGDGGSAKGDGGAECGPAQRAQNCLSRQCGDDGCGGFCGTAGGACPDGKECDSRGLCVAKTCSSTAGACGPDQYCDTSGSNPVCAEICGPSGCLPGETCVHNPDGKTGQCEPPRCPAGTGMLCQPGQVCGWWGELKPCSDDTACSGADKCETLPGGKFCSHPECSCEPAHVDPAGAEHEDTCWPYGKVCDMAPDVAGVVAPSACRKPGELEDCKSTVGCEALGDGFGELECVEGSGFAVCLRRCTNGAVADTAKCALGFTRCYAAGAVQGHCYFNYCSNVAACAPTDSACQDRERDAYFKPCSMTGPNDSTCLQVIDGDGTERGVCFQGGTAASGGECDLEGLRSDGAPYPKHCRAPVVDANGNIVTPGEVCVRVEPKDPADPRKGYLGTCQPLCNAYLGADRKPALGCAGAGEVCLDVLADPDVEKTRMGACVKGCDPFGNDPCPDDSLGNKQGCRPADDLAGGGYCRALKGDAAGFGQPCVTDDIDPRSPCGDRMTCQQPAGHAFGKCTGWCQRAECSDPGASCAACAGLVCCQKTCQPGRCGVPDGCGGTCGCAAGEKCNDANLCEACVKACTATTCGLSDGCGGTCGCGTGEVCNTSTSACCTPTCLAGACGGDDGCGGTCGCASGEVCNTGDGTCCTPTCTAGSCGGDDGCGGTCGCATGETCDAGTCQTCVTTCAADACEVDDGCGGRCQCAAGQVCDPAAKTCAPCVRDCYLKACGDDGCGGTCGDCGPNGACVVSGGDQRCQEVRYDGTSGAWQTTAVQACNYHCAAKDEGCTRDADCCTGTTCAITPPDKAGKCQ